MNSAVNNSDVFFLIRGVGWDWVHLISRLLLGVLYQLLMMTTIGQCGAIGGMRADMWNRSTRKKPTSVPHFAPNDLTWDRTRAAAVEFTKRSLDDECNVNSCWRDKATCPNERWIFAAARKLISFRIIQYNGISGYLQRELPVYH
jgi:hypothetical protein